MHFSSCEKKRHNVKTNVKVPNHHTNGKYFVFFNSKLQPAILFNTSLMSEEFYSCP